MKDDNPSCHHFYSVVIVVALALPLAFSSVVSLPYLDVVNSILCDIYSPDSRSRSRRPIAAVAIVAAVDVAIVVSHAIRPLPPPAAHRRHAIPEVQIVDLGLKALLADDDNLNDVAEPNGDATTTDAHHGAEAGDVQVSGVLSIRAERHGFPRFLLAVLREHPDLPVALHLRRLLPLLLVLLLLLRCPSSAVAVPTLSAAPECAVAVVAVVSDVRLVSMVNRVGQGRGFPMALPPDSDEDSGR